MAKLNELPEVLAPVGDEPVIIVSGGRAKRTRFDRLAAGVVNAVTAAGNAILEGNRFVLEAATLQDAAAKAAEGQQAVVPQANGYAQDRYLKQASGLVLQRTEPVGDGVIATEKLAVQNFPPMPRPPIISIYGVQGRFNDGVIVPNSMAARPTRQFMHMLDQISDRFGGGAVTFGQPDPWGGNTAIRLRLPDASQVIAFFLPQNAGGHRIFCLAKSAAGAGNQSLILRQGFTTPAVATPINEGAWLPADVIFPALADTVNVRTDGGSLDCYITPPCVGPPEIAFPARPVPAIGALVPKDIGATGGIKIDNFGNIIMPYAGRLKFTADGIAKASFTEMTVMMTYKQTGGLGYAAPLWQQQASGDFSMGTEGGRGTFSYDLPGLHVNLANAQNSLMTPIGDEFVTQAMGFNATSSFASLGSMIMARGTGTGGSPFTIARAFFGGAGLNDSFPNTGLLNSFHVWDRLLTETELSQATRHVEGFAQSLGNAVGMRNIVIPDGNGLSAAQPPGGATGYVQLACANLHVKFVAVAAAGSGIAEIMAEPRLTNTKNLIRQAVRDGKNVIYSVMVFGALADIPKIAALGVIVRSLGAKFVVLDTSSWEAVSYVDQVAFNNALAGVPCDAVCRISSVPLLGAEGANANPAIFYDRLHWTQAGHGAGAVPYQATISGLLV